MTRQDSIRSRRPVRRTKAAVVCVAAVLLAADGSKAGTVSERSPVPHSTPVAIGAGAIGGPETTTTPSTYGCRIFPFQGEPLPPHETCCYGYAAADVRAGAVCAFSIRPDSPDYVFRLAADVRDNTFTRLEVVTPDGETIQRIDLPRHEQVTPPHDAAFLRVDDIDGDGNRDVGLLVAFQHPDNYQYRYFVFDSETGRFIEDTPIHFFWNPTIDPQTKEVVEHENEGGGGMLYTRTWHRFERDQLRRGDFEIVRQETQRWVDDHYEQVTWVLEPGHEREPGMSGPSLVSREIIVPDPAEPYDAHQWEVVRTATTGFGPDLPEATIVLLRSREVTGSSGVGGALHDANLVITRGTEVLYRLKSDPPHFDGHSTATQFVSDEPRLELKDVTGDGIPEVAFETEFWGASDGTTEHHLLHWDTRHREFKDIQQPTFTESLFGRTRWLEVAGWPVAFVFHPFSAWECHMCPHYYRYDFYCWSAELDAFQRIYSATSSEAFRESPSKKDIDALMPHVGEAVKRACLRHDAAAQNND